jgi:putative alpha-1,2-mannosidase
MAALLVFHILGLYPVPASKQLLLGSPLLSSFTIKNDLFGTSTRFIVKNFDSRSIQQSPSLNEDIRMFVSRVTVNGTPTDSICWLSWDDVVGGGEIEITVDWDAAAAQERGCAGSLPDSLATGGFSTS